MNLKLIIKGFIVGIGKIIPGVSGSMLALGMGIYELVINAITNFFDDIKTNFKFLFNFGFGCFLAIMLFSKLILFLLNNYYYQVIYLFLGLIIGTLIDFGKELKFTKKNIILFGLVLFISLILGNFKGPTFIFKGNLIHYFYVLILGFIDALTSIVPGISGTVIYMLLGSYEFVLGILANPFTSLFIIYLGGLFLGIIIVCLIMHYLLKYKKDQTYIVIMALMVGSLIILFLSILNSFNLSLLIYLLIGLGIGIKCLK